MDSSLMKKGLRLRSMTTISKVSGMDSYLMKKGLRRYFFKYLSTFFVWIAP